MSIDRPQLLITGASGQLARRAAEIVLASYPANRVTLVTRNPGALAEFAVRGASVRFADFAEPDSLGTAFTGAERLLLVSATDLEHRLAQHEAAIDVAVACGVTHVVYTSGLTPAPPNPAVVAPSHYETERHLASSGIDFTVLRNSLYADFQVAEAVRSLETGTLVHNRGDGRTAYVAREDCAAAAAAVISGDGHEGAVYDVTGAESYDAAELAELYAAVGGKPVQAVALDDDSFVKTLVGDATEDEHLKYGAALVASFGRSIREGFMASCTHTAETLTGRPTRTLRDVLQISLAREGERK
jgi:NAD(P)H dehydrogenase (quinone)